MSVILITHDLGVVAQVADRVAVMYAGKIAEIGTRKDIFYQPQHPYTKGLLASVPRLDLDGAGDPNRRNAAGFIFASAGLPVCRPLSEQDGCV